MKEMDENRGFILRTVSRDQAKDTGMAAAFVCLLIAYFGQKQYFLLAAMLLLVLNMIWPDAYKPFARVWFGLSLFLGTFASKVILTVLFFVLVTPVGVLRRLIGSDTLQLGKWKKDKSSVFTVRDCTFKPDNLEKPY